jgi:hypothetical protein
MRATVSNTQKRWMGLHAQNTQIDSQHTKTPVCQTYKALLPSLLGKR